MPCRKIVRPWISMVVLHAPYSVESTITALCALRRSPFATTTVNRYRIVYCRNGCWPSKQVKTSTPDNATEYHTLDPYSVCMYATNITITRTANALPYSPASSGASGASGASGQLPALAAMVPKGANRFPSSPWIA